MPNKRDELAKNTLIISFGGLSGQVVAFLLLPLYTAYLQTSAYGTVDLIITYVALLTPVITIQLGMGAFRFLINARGNDKELSSIITTVVHTAVLLVVVFAAASLPILKLVHIPYAYLVLLSICTGAFSGIFMQFARGLNRNGVYALGGIVTALTTATLNVILLAVLHMGVKGVFVSAILANSACGVYLFMTLRLHKYLKFKRHEKNMQKELLKYSWPLVTNGISWWIINAADRTIIAIFLGLSSNGIYAIAYKFPTIFNTLSSYFNLSWTESASVHINDDDKDQFFSEVMGSSVRFFGSLAALMIAYTSLIFGVFVNHRYGKAYDYIPILVVASFFSAVVALYGAIYIAKKQTKQVGNTSMFAAIINIVLTLALVKIIGLYGTSLATVAGYFAMTIYRHYDAKKYVMVTYEKNLIVKLVVFYAFASALYYYNNMILNFINAIAVTVIAIFLNRSVIKTLRHKVYSKLKRLSPEQEIAEMSDI